MSSPQAPPFQMPVSGRAANHAHLDFDKRTGHFLPGGQPKEHGKDFNLKSNKVLRRKGQRASPWD